jgi:hypothetical protein
VLQWETWSQSCWGHHWFKRKSTVTSYLAIFHLLLCVLSPPLGLFADAATFLVAFAFPLSAWSVLSFVPKFCVFLEVWNFVLLWSVTLLGLCYLCIWFLLWLYVVRLT